MQNDTALAHVGRRFRRTAALLAVVGLALAGLSAQPTLANPIRDHAIVVSDATNSLRPQVAVDGSGALHIVWYDGGDFDRSVKYAKGTPAGAGYAWSGPFEIYKPGGAPSFIHPRIAVDRQNPVHVVWSWKSSGGDTVFYQRWPAGGQPGQSGGPQVLGAGLLPAIATDANSRLHVVWEREYTDGNFEIFYREGDGGSFGPEQNISNNGRESLSPDIAIDASGVPHVVWYDKTPGAQTVLYTRRGPGGWQAPQGLSAPDSVFPSIAADAQGCVHLAWNEVSNEAIVYRRVCNGNVEAGRIVSGGGEPRRPAVGATAGGNVVVAWDARAGAANIFYAAFSNGQWAAQQRVAAGGTNQLWVDVAGLPNNEMGIVWQEDRDGQFDPSVALVSFAPAPAPPAPAPPAPAPVPAPVVGPPTGSFDFASPAFRDLWSRTDSLVAGRAVNRSWLWGPTAFTERVVEPYAQTPGGGRTVQYFDKTRMEINQPNAPRGPFYVTSGRLADELITGLMQVGDAQYEQRGPARVPVAGDPSNTFPLYSDLQAVYRKPGGDRANQIMSRAPDGGVRLDVLPGANNDPSMVIAQRVNGLGIPRIFWDYMNRPGRAVENGRVVNANPLFSWRYVLGEPLTEAYWTFVKVGGQDRGVLVQVFERRVLTYTPSNTPEYMVEMGNIGRQYFEWRYGVAPR